jgi:transposase
MIDRVRVKQLFELNFPISKIKSIIGKQYSNKTLYSWKNLSCDVNSIVIKHSSGRPTKTSFQVNKKIKQMAMTKKMSLRQISRTLKKPKLCHATVRKILKNEGLKPFKRRVIGKMNDGHQKARFEFANKYKNEPLTYFESLLITDSKIFTLNGSRNSQNDVQWAFSPEDLESYPKEKFPKSVHVYGGMSHMGLTELIYVNGNVNAKQYVENILPKLTTNIQYRKKTKGKVNEIKLFDDNKSFIFEQDHAKSHDSKLAQDWCLKNLKSFLNKDETPAKMDDYWPIERLWGILLARVYKEP